MKRLQSLLLLLLCGTAISLAHEVLYTFNYDLITPPNTEKALKGTGTITIYDDQVIEIYAKAAHRIYRYSLTVKSVNNTYDSILSLFSTNDSDLEFIQPYLGFMLDGNLALYVDDRDSDHKILMGMKCSETGPNNKAAMQSLFETLENHTGIFKNFRSNKDTELPLKIDGHVGSYQVTIPSAGTEKAYSVRTKTGKLVDESVFKDYEIECDAWWVDIKLKNGGAFLLNIPANNTGSERTATVTLTCAGIKSTMTIKQPPQRAEIDNIWVDHNAWSGMVKGMKIHVKFHTNGVRGQTGACNAYFFFANGQKLMDYNGSYRSIDGQVCVGNNFSPGYDSAVYNDFVLFMPYNELHISGSADCNFQVQVQIGGTTVISDPIAFSFKN